jgi:hypothetical protein
VDAQPTGSGVIRSFVRVQSAGVEEGYNTDARPLQMDENKSRTFTRSLTVGQVPVVWVNNVAYREFLLDVNQKASSPLLSLDELRLYVGAAGNLTGYDATAKTLADLAPVYDMDGAGDVTVKLDYRLNPGSGGGDMVVLIPEAAFAGQPAGGFVYLYSRFGDSWRANAGFEEWAVRAGPSQPPPAPESSLSGYVYYDDDGDGLREPTGNEMLVPEIGIEGVTLHLQGVTTTGQLVDLYASTDSDGHYSFGDLAAGTYYSITKVADPPGWWDGRNTPGTLGGQVDESDPNTSGDDRIFDIVLAAGIDGLEYNFGQLPVIQPG